MELLDPSKRKEINICNDWLFWYIPHIYFICLQTSHSFPNVSATMDDCPHCVWSASNPGNNGWSPGLFSGSRLVKNIFLLIIVYYKLYFHFYKRKRQLQEMNYLLFKMFILGIPGRRLYIYHISIWRHR